MSARGVAQRIARVMQLGTDGELLASDLRVDRPRRPTLDGPAIHVDGLDDVLVRLSTCCTPVPDSYISPRLNCESKSPAFAAR